MVVANIAVLLIIIGCLSVLFYLQNKEGFGYSMGTMIQLSTSHVPNSLEEMEEEKEQYVQMINRDLIDMTGSGLF